ncbi:hypothetical protein ABL78_7229 [Leptomonas seymouri]|uniref:Uncharacterized protein n=1 Tax=Leptomonas seymouri TaxID=5684 RepID=A0A0N0P351_LEPSE|nr:hypothetical protein ABL78_7229 [Leptomonas seymouri]|eukprot:KPI83726.1 hypothetical protein ABL78_7229 [Leptomonas seymouri]
MTSLRSLVLYAADRHTAALVAVFALFAVIIFQCGNTGAREVELRHASSTLSNVSTFAPVPLARTTAVAFVSLSETDVEVLSGGPLPHASHSEWSDEADAAMARRWHRHFVLGDITIVAVPTAYRSHRVVHHWFSYLESLCVDCHVIPLMDDDVSEELNTTHTVQSSPSLHRFCSAVAKEGGDPLITRRHPSRLSPETVLDAEGLDVLLLDRVPEVGSELPQDMPVGCGVLVFLTPKALRSYSSGTLGNVLRHSTTTSSHDGTLEFESMLARSAAETDPPLGDRAPAATAAVHAPPLSLVTREGEAARVYEGVGNALATHVGARVGYQPQYLLYAAWCSSARTYGFRTPSQSLLRRGQSTLHILCLQANEIVDVTPMLQRFVRVSEASVL